MSLTFIMSYFHLKYTDDRKNRSKQGFLKEYEQKYKIYYSTFLTSLHQKNRFWKAFIIDPPFASLKFVH